MTRSIMIAASHLQGLVGAGEHRYRVGAGGLQEDERIVDISLWTSGDEVGTVLGVIVEVGSERQLDRVSEFTPQAIE